MSDAIRDALLRTELKRIQDDGFALCKRNEELSLAARRTLRALDGYWAAYEVDGRRMEVWWATFEKWRSRLEAIA